MSRTVDTPADALVAALDTVRALVRSWGDMNEGSPEQAHAILNGSQCLQALLTAAHEVDMAAAVIGTSDRAKRV